MEAAGRVQSGEGLCKRAKEIKVNEKAAAAEHCLMQLQPF